MNFSIKNNSLSRPVVVSQRLLESTGRSLRSVCISSALGRRINSLRGERVRPTSSSRAFILEPETDLLQACQRGLTVFVLDLLGQARCIRDGINLFVGFRHDHDQQATQFVGDVAEAAVLSARYSDHVKWLQYERVLAPIAPGDLETAGEAEKVLDRIEMAVKPGSVAGLALGIPALANWSRWSDT